MALVTGFTFWCSQSSVEFPSSFVLAFWPVLVCKRLAEAYTDGRDSQRSRRRELLLPRCHLHTLAWILTSAPFQECAQLGAADQRGPGAAGPPPPAPRAGPVALDNATQGHRGPAPRPNCPREGSYPATRQSRQLPGQPGARRDVTAPRPRKAPPRAASSRPVPSCLVPRGCARRSERTTWRASCGRCCCGAAACGLCCGRRRWRPPREVRAAWLDGQRAGRATETAGSSLLGAPGREAPAPAPASRAWEVRRGPSVQARFLSLHSSPAPARLPFSRLDSSRHRLLGALKEVGAWGVAGSGGAAAGSSLLKLPVQSGSARAGGAAAERGVFASACGGERTDSG